MTSIIDEKGEDMREINFDQFLTDLNKQMIRVDQRIEVALGLQNEDSAKNKKGAQSPEDIAKEEAERERLLQESM